MYGMRFVGLIFLLRVDVVLEFGCERCKGKGILHRLYDNSNETQRKQVTSAVTVIARHEGKHRGTAVYSNWEDLSQEEFIRRYRKFRQTSTIGLCEPSRGRTMKTFCTATSLGLDGMQLLRRASLTMMRPYKTLLSKKIRKLSDRHGP